MIVSFYDTIWMMMSYFLPQTYTTTFVCLCGVPSTYLSIVISSTSHTREELCARPLCSCTANIHKSAQSEDDSGSADRLLSFCSYDHFQ